MRPRMNCSYSVVHTGCFAKIIKTGVSILSSFHKSGSTVASNSLTATCCGVFSMSALNKSAPKFFIRRILCELVIVCTHLSYCRATASVAVFKVGRRSVCPTTSRMAKSVAIVGAGVSGLTCGVFFAEHGFQTAIFAEQIGQQTTSGAAAALWFPYDAGPADKMVPWALASYKVLVDLIKDSRTGVSMIELRQYSRASEISIPDWAHPFVSTSPSVISSEAETSLDISASAFSSGFSLNVPLMDTTIYLDYLADRFQKAGGAINEGVHFEKLEDVDPKFGVVINCAGIGA